MIALLVYGFLVLSVIFISVSLYSRAQRRQKLNAWYAESDQSQTREEYVRQGLVDYESSLRRKLIWAVYIIPICFVVVMIYVMNFM